MSGPAPSEVEGMLEACGALLTGHFVLTSGLHSGRYVEKFRLLERPDLTSRLCEKFVEAFRPLGVQTVVGPVTGGILLAFETGRQLGVRAVYVERHPDGKDKGMVLRRGFRIAPGERVAVVEDILTTGTSIREVLEVLARAQAQVMSIGVLVDRRAKDAPPSEIFGKPLVALSRLQIESFPAEACPLCRQGLPAVKPGSRPSV